MRRATTKLVNRYCTSSFEQAAYPWTNVMKLRRKYGHRTERPTESKAI